MSEAKVTWLTGLTEQELWAAYGFYADAIIAEDKVFPAPFELWLQGEKQLAQIIEYRNAEFLPAIQKLRLAGLSCGLEHTGGGVYVLYHYPAGSRDARVGITPSETHEGKWLVVGYLQPDDEGTYLMTVPYDDLAATVDDMAERVTNHVEKRIYRIPVEFLVEVEGESTKFIVLPKESDPGYFGVSVHDAESGHILTEGEKRDFWATVTDHIDEHTETITVHWQN